jgi:hypothetical protein
MQCFDEVRVITDKYASEGAPRGSIGNIVEDLSDRAKYVQIWIPEHDLTPLIVVDISEIELAPPSE